MQINWKALTLDLLFLASLGVATWGGWQLSRPVTAILGGLGVAAVLVAVKSAK